MKVKPVSKVMNVKSMYGDDSDENDEEVKTNTSNREMKEVRNSKLQNTKF